MIPKKEIENAVEDLIRSSYISEYFKQVIIQLWKEYPKDSRTLPRGLR